MDATVSDRSEALQRRLYGSANRISWRPDDVMRIMAHLGIVAEEFGAPSAALAYPSPVRLLAAEASEIAAVAAGSRAVKSDGGAADRRLFKFIISNGDLDRYGDTVAVNGWMLSAYRKNPLVLWQHQSGLLPIGRATNVWIEGGNLKAIAELAPADVNPDAEQVRKMLVGGYLAATSVGFIPIKYKFSQDPARKYGVDFLEQELLEFSIVTVPALASALLEPGQTGKALQPSPMTEKQRADDRRRREVDAIRLRWAP